MQLGKAYSHKDVEAKWYGFWLKSDAFAPAMSSGPCFSMVIPPPNVTGSLHMGHALNNTLQDILCRYKRMDGYRVLWVPGTDHAGIATQNVVERRLAEQGITRSQLGRQKFVERVWVWKAEAGNLILHQLKALGVSCDWHHERFTMDEGLSRAVREAFVRLWEQDLLYRAERLINWCPRCKTALADIEVVHEEADGHLWHIKYPLADDPSKAIIVATTRPETMLGDTAVAVHPEDPRYRAFAGKEVRLPIVERTIPVLSDSYVDRQFGTGALKITPGHDFNDFEIGERFGLDKISIFDADAKIDGSTFSARGEGGAWVARYDGKDRFEARELIVGELKEKGSLTSIENHKHAIGRCYRCQTIIEPYLTPQWFVRVKPLAETAMRVVREGEIRIIPEAWSNSYFAWMENIKDWTISRQIWWGHQIPAWYCKNCDHPSIVRTGSGEFFLTKDARPIVSRSLPERCPRCNGQELLQDPDVLDTWFSSSLWPFSTLGWPEKTSDLETFYPTATLVTGFDILFFWVARMIMMGMKLMDDVPFRDVYIHALVRDEQGQKMSKSKGNVIDPLDIMSQYGTDAFRFTLAAMAAMGRDIRLAEERIAGYQNFVNKLWNAARFVLMYQEGVSVATGSQGAQPVANRTRVLDDRELNFADRWIRSRLAATIAQAREAIDSYRFNDYASVLYQFTWHEFCDWYIEMSKLALNGRVDSDVDRSKRFLAELLEEILLLLHPLMPFVTEEVWQVMSENRPTIMLQAYPRPLPEWSDENTEREMEFLMGVVRAVRNLRTELNLAPAKEITIVFRGEDRDLGFLSRQEAYIRFLTRAGTVEYSRSAERPAGAVTAVVGGTEIYLPLGDLINLAEESARLTKEIAKIDGELARVQQKLSNEQFVTRAKTEIIQKERNKAVQLDEKLRALKASLATIVSVKAGRS